MLDAKNAEVSGIAPNWNVTGTPNSSNTLSRGLLPPDYFTQRILSFLLCAILLLGRLKAANVIASLLPGSLLKTWQ
jgi:hypothetical protein